MLTKGEYFEDRRVPDAPHDARQVVELFTGRKRAERSKRATRRKMVGKGNDGCRQIKGTTATKSMRDGANATASLG
jgi:hypothetical protein